MRKDNVIKLPDFEVRCMVVAAKKFSNTGDAKRWLRNEHGIYCHGDILKFHNPDLR